jgi:hypothetical protein
MKKRQTSLFFIVFAGGLAALCLSTAQAVTMQECSAKYKSAKADGSLKGMSWNDFRKAQCGSEAESAPAAAPAKSASPAPETVPAKPSAAAPAPAKATTAKPAAAEPPPAAAGDAVFPTEISPKYASESPGKARMHTCLDQYNANKTTNANGGLKWIQKGGGYYSECTKKLK